MKRILTYLLALTVSSVAFAQAPSTGKVARIEPKKVYEYVDLEQPAFYKHNPANLRDDASQIRSGRGGVTYIPIGTSYNLYSILLDDQNQVSFHPDINSVTFTHRQNSGTAGGSGGISFDVSTDGGATWATNYIVTPDYNAGVYSGLWTGNRYPSGTIYNPDGNTDPNNAYFVGNGPSLTAASATWGATYRASSTLNNLNVSEVYYQNALYPYDFHPYATNYYDNGNLWSISTTYNNTGDAANDLISYAGFYVNQINFNAGTNSFDYTTTDLVPTWHIYTDATSGALTNHAGYSWQVAFDPSGTIGYVNLVGALSGTSPLTPKPTLWKTTDAGATWSLLPDFDFGGLTEFEEWTIPTWDGGYNPWCIGNDMVVDADGTLHLFGEYVSRSTFSEADDSLTFSWSDFTTFMHLTTSDGADWTAKNIGYSFLTDAPYGAVAAIPYRLQASITPDGKKVFMTYSMSDSTLVADHSLPNLIALGYDTESGEYTNQVNFTEGTDFDGGAFFPTLSPYTMDLGGMYELPVVFALPGADDLAPPQYYYMKGITFEDADFGAEAAADADFTYSISDCIVSFSNASLNSTTYSWDYGDGSATSPLENPTHTFSASGTYNVCLTSSNASSSDVACKDVTVVCQSIEDVLLEGSLSVYPTLSSGYVVVDLKDNANLNAFVSVTNILGETVASPISMNNTITLNLSDLAEGNYLVRVQTENGVATRQITIVK